MGDDREALLNRNNNRFKRCVSHAQDELQSFRSYLRWMFVDQSNVWRACLSWFMFILFAILVPAISHFVFACATCDGNHKRPYDSVVQLSLSSVATVSFVCLSWFVRKFGLRRFLFFDKLYYESETVRREYTAQLNVSLIFLNISISWVVFFIFIEFSLITSEIIDWIKRWTYFFFPLITYPD